MNLASMVTAAVFLAVGSGWPAQGQDEGPDQRWSVGALGLLNISPFAGEDDEVLPVPYISYRGERFYLEGLEAGYHLMTPRRGPGTALVLDVVTAARMTPGSSRDKVTVDAGLRFGLEGKFGSLSLTGLQDITGEHDGMELGASYSYTFRGADYFITPGIGVSWQNKKMANHMWGVTAEQQAGMIEDGEEVILPIYSLSDSLLNYEAGVTAVYMLNDRLNLVGFSQATYLDRDVRDNPGIDRKYALTVGLGIAYSF